MTGTDLCVNKPQSVPVIFEPPCNCSAFLHSQGQQPNLLYLLLHSKVLCLTVSKPGKMIHGHSLMGGHCHIQHSTRNLLLRSASSRHRYRSPKHHHCLPETLLPKMLVCKSSAGLIWIHIHSYKLICEMNSRAVTISLKFMLLSHEFLQTLILTSGVAL